jgi:hypothetical protein
MDSTCLPSLGVSSWMPLVCTTERIVLAGLPTTRGVYVIVLPTPEQRRRGASDIAYIGRATNRNGLQGRIRQYYHPGPTQSTNQAMKQRLYAEGCALRLGFVVSDSATRLESDLLERFEAEHDELPPFNKQRALDLLSRHRDDSRDAPTS